MSMYDKIQFLTDLCFYLLKIDLFWLDWQYFVEESRQRSAIFSSQQYICDLFYVTTTFKAVNLF